MSDTNQIFSRFPRFIQEFIYSSGWESLRDVQVAAARCIFESGNNLLLTSSTASGKTEAVFFPILTQMCEDPPRSVGVIYLAPLKSLINDQFARIDALLDESGVPVFHWHGDVAASHKQKLLRCPEGILQITPESLEGLLLRRSNEIPRLFGDLRYVIIDELHTLTGNDRGNQIICQLTRLAHMIGRFPRRIGLSATIGDPALAAEWLAGGSGHDTDIPGLEIPKIKWRLGIEHFFKQELDPVVINQEAKAAGDLGKTNETTPESSPLPPESLPIPDADLPAVPIVRSGGIDAGYEFAYDCVKDKKSLVFSNSREETEYITATLRQIARNRGEDDIFLIHHGFLSASIREEAEAKMKDEETHAVTCATVTMELGIDIGKLERIFHIDAPHSASSFLQRLGRSGRRGEPPEMIMLFREETPVANTPLPQLIPWGLLRAIAIIQLYIEERFIEPPLFKKMPLSLAFQQTLSIAASAGEMTARELAGRVLALPAFRFIPKEDYRALLLAMIRADFLQLTDEGGVIVGMAGERLTDSFKFLATFRDNEDYTVRCGSDEIGLITSPPPLGDRFALAGRVWEVTELDLPRRLIYVKSVGGKMEIGWPGEFGEIHTRILQRMRRVLCEDAIYPYLMPQAAARLAHARHIAGKTGMTRQSLLCLGGYSWCMFPWLGTRSFRTLRRYLGQYKSEFKLSNIEFEGCCYMTFRMERGGGEALIRAMDNRIKKEGIDAAALVGANENPAHWKYDEFIPAELLRHAFIADGLRVDEIPGRIEEMTKELK